MDNKTKSTDIPQKGNILIINTGSTTTKLGYFPTVSVCSTQNWNTPRRMSPNIPP